MLDPGARLASGKPIMSTEFYERLKTEGSISLEGKELREFLGRTGGIIGTSGTDYVAVKDYAGLQRLILKVESFDPETGQDFYGWLYRHKIWSQCTSQQGLQYPLERGWLATLMNE